MAVTTRLQLDLHPTSTRPPPDFYLISTRPLPLPLPLPLFYLTEREWCSREALRASDQTGFARPDTGCVPRFYDSVLNEIENIKPLQSEREWCSREALRASDQTGFARPGPDCVPRFTAIFHSR